MNYFELYSIPVSFEPDLSVVKQQFYALSKKYHPDFYVNEPQEKQEEVLELSTLNNKAYKTLVDPAARMQYVLTLHNMLPEGENYVLPQNFLMEMMDVNESLMELEFDPDEAVRAKLKEEVEKIDAALREELQELTASFETADNTTQQDILLKIKDLFYRNKYLLRIKGAINK